MPLHCKDLNTSSDTQSLGVVAQSRVEHPISNPLCVSCRVNLIRH